MMSGSVEAAPGPSSRVMSASSSSNSRPPIQSVFQSSSSFSPILSAPKSALIPSSSSRLDAITFSAPSQLDPLPSSTSDSKIQTTPINIARLSISPQTQQRKDQSSFHSSRRRRSASQKDSLEIVAIAQLENTLKLPSLGVYSSRPNPAAAPKVTLSSRCKPDAKVIFDQSYFSRKNKTSRSITTKRDNDISRPKELSSNSESVIVPETVSLPRQGDRLPSDDSVSTPASLGSLLTGGVTAATSTTPDIDSQSVTSTSSSIPATSTKRPAWSTPRSWAEMAAARGSNGNNTLSLSTQIFSENVGDNNASSGTSGIATNSKNSPNVNKRQLANGKNKANEPIGLEDAVKKAESSFTAPLTYPRGMVNRGNMCFANAILQVLVYCAPFYNLFHLVGDLVTHDFHNSTPLMEAVISFLSEFQTISPTLQKSLREAPGLAMDLLRDVQAASDPFVPEYLYEAMKLNKRFDAMRRGHQEDAEEFLGFFLDTLHEELLTAIKISNDKMVAGKVKDGKSATSQNNKAVQPSNTLKPESTAAAAASATTEREVKRPVSPMEGDGWLEVGQKGRTSFTRTTSTAHSPITRIFGGKLRSLLRVPGSKDSVTLEPYQPLQLDIQPLHVTTIEEALENLTVPETISGVQSSLNRGMVEATKQVFIETLPPILILHLKRFVYDDVGGVQKSSKVLSYGPVLDISESVISPARRGEAKRRYRLFGVVYHHGRHASGGHYTVDVLKQDQSEWLHIDDTIWNSAITPSVKVGSEGATKQHHDGVAYLLFYVREDAVLSNGIISNPSNGQSQSSPISSNHYTYHHHRKTDSLNHHRRMTSSTSQRSLNSKR